MEEVHSEHAMSAKCQLRKCQRDTATCRCRRCNHLMHDWQVSQVVELRSELQCMTSRGKMRYEKFVLHKDRCAVCGAERESTLRNLVDL